MKTLHKTSFRRPEGPAGLCPRGCQPPRPGPPATTLARVGTCGPRRELSRGSWSSAEGATV